MVASLFSLKNVSKFFSIDQEPALQSISLDIQRGERLALVGQSGSGKTTLARLLAGYIKPTEGIIRLIGMPHPGAPIASIQIISQSPTQSLTPHLRIMDILKDGPIGQLNDYLNLLKLPKRVLEAYPHDLSGGEVQRVALLRALLKEPNMLICDESFAALDAPLKKEILELVIELQKQLDFTWLWVTHQLDLAKEYCSKIFLLERGRITSTYERGEWSETTEFIKEMEESYRWLEESK